MNPRILSHLVSLYGTQEGQAASGKVAALLADWRMISSAAGRVGEAGNLTQLDALLITYADQVGEPGKPPLQTLGESARQHLQGIISGVHILPFYPWSSDDGFSVRDYFEVDPRYGSWEDIERLGEDFDLMFDAVFNHMSAQGDWFQRFLRDEPAFRDFFVTVDGNPDLSQVIRPRALPLPTAVAFLIPIEQALVALFYTLQAHRHAPLAQAATSRATEELWNSQLAQASALRWRGKVGRRRRAVGKVTLERC